MLTRNYTRLLLLLMLGFLCGCSQTLMPAYESSSASEYVARYNPRPAHEKSDLKILNSNGRTDQDKDHRLLDSATELYQTSNDYWEKGDRENAIAALDRSYALLLGIGTDADQGVLQEKEDLRYAISRRVMEIHASRFNAVNGHKNAIPLVTNRHVENALKTFQGPERSFFMEAYVRSGRYRPAIVRALTEEGLPQELSWLPLLESGFKTRALSPARALGMWQFVASTGYKFGLQRNAWIDERMDPEKSTKAAVAYLKELHSIFGDWTTALAAYNCGEARVLNEIKRQKINYLDDFWDLFNRLPYETASYVPKFIAMLHILNDPKKYGFSLPPVENEIAAEEVTISRQLHLATIASSIGIAPQELRDLNAELRQDMTPPLPYALKVLEGKAELVLAKLDDIPVYVPPVPPYTMHQVRRGESLKVIASKYRVSADEIMSINDLNAKSAVRAGTTIKIPTSKGGRSYAKVRAPIQSPEFKETLTKHVVKDGESLWEIAEKFNSTTSAIESLNQLADTRLTVGQVLLIPKVREQAAAGIARKYIVKQGDSPFVIAKKHNMDLTAFLRLNRLTTTSTIFPGQRVLVGAD